MNHVNATRSGHLAELVIARPPINLFDLDTVTDTEGAVAQIAAWVREGSCRAVLLRAEGKVFCGGVDVHAFQNLDAAQGAMLMTRLLALTQSLEALPVPVISVAHGLTLTIGFELCMGTDLIWAAPETEFGLVEATVGLTPGAGGTQRLVARAGVARAAELVMTGDLYRAETLMQWGVVNRLVPKGELLESARQFAHRLAGGPTIATGVAKQLLLATRDRGVADADALTPSAVGPLLTTSDLANGVESLLNKGPGQATFHGR